MKNVCPLAAKVEFNQDIEFHEGTFNGKQYLACVQP
jgi:hypothetical protein